MRNIGFIGAHDKTDLLIYVSKILTELGSRILIIDGTTAKRAKYVVPVINSQRRYITNYEGIDVAIGFHELEEVKMYLGGSPDGSLQYDFVFYDIEEEDLVEGFEIDKCEIKFFVTGFDNYTLKKGLETLNELHEKNNIIKVCYAPYAIKEDDDYLNFLASEMQINWNEEIIYFPNENGDLNIINEGHRLGKIRFKKISIQFKDGLTNIIGKLIGSNNDSEVRRIIKRLEKGD